MPVRLLALLGGLACAPAAAAQDGLPPVSPLTRVSNPCAHCGLPEESNSDARAFAPPLPLQRIFSSDAESLPGTGEQPTFCACNAIPTRSPGPGPLFRTDAYPTVQINGVFQLDSGWFHQDAAGRASVGNIRDGASFRRARLSASGGVAENLAYRFEMDFAFFGRPTFTDLWMEFQEVPLLGNVRIGQWKQPFSLEVVSPFRYTTFAERSLLFPAFAPFRHIAVGFLDHSDDERVTWAASVYRSGQDQFGGSLADRGGYAGVGRITFLPWYDERTDGRRYLHLGAAYNVVAPNNRVARFRTIPEYFVFEQRPGAIGSAGVALPGVFDGVPFFVDTGTFGVRHYNLVGTELLWVEGPLSVQSEFMYLAADRTAGGTAGFPGLYVQCGYFLTGEHRPYNRPRAFITRIEPFRSVTGPGRGPGAWEVATRWSGIDLNDRDIRGGTLNNWTVGLNWYVNAYSKLQFNYIRAGLDDPRFGRSVTEIYGLRAQLDF